jgi:pyruvate-formate lyase-activating enzyme
MCIVIFLFNIPLFLTIISTSGNNKFRDVMEPIDGIHRSRSSKQPSHKHDYDDEAKREQANQQRKEHLEELKEQYKKRKQDRSSEGENEDNSHEEHHHGNNPNLGKRLDLDG